MASQESLDRLYMDIAVRVSKMSHATRNKVGCVIVKDDNIISMGWNGTPSGSDNECEYIDDNGNLVTKPEVLHAERNALMKLTASGGVSTKDAILYVTLSPCFECSMIILQSKIKRIVFKDEYRIITGLPELSKRGLKIDKINENGIIVPYTMV